MCCVCVAGAKEVGAGCVQIYPATLDKAYLAGEGLKSVLKHERLSLKRHPLLSPSASERRASLGAGRKWAWSGLAGPLVWGSGDVCRGPRMTSNGREGGAMTGSGGTRTSDSLSWLGSAGSGAVPRTTTSASHDLLPPGPSTPNAPGIFRTPLTVAESSHLFSAQYGAGLPVPSTTSSLLPYSPAAYARHNQSSLGPYHYFSQYHTYPPGVLGAHYSLEHSQSYSEELRRMGSQVTQHMPQLPRSPLFHGPLPHSFGQLTQTTSPGPSLPQGLNTIGITGHPASLRRDSKSPPAERHEASPAKEGKPHTKMYSFPTQESKETGYKFKDPQRRLSRHTVTFETDPPGRRSQSPLHKPLGPPPAKRPKDSTAMGGGEAGPSRRPAAPAAGPSHPHYPPHFMKGSIIQLANGQLKYVEDLRTEDFVNSADVSSDLKIDSSTVVRVEEFEDKGTVELGFLVGEHRVQVYK